MEGYFSRNRDQLILLAIVAAALATRIPLLAVLRPYEDEVFYALIGHEWLQGALPYTQIFDVKPPGLFALYALCEAISGDALLGPRLLPLLGVLASAIGLWRIARAWFEDWRVGPLAAILYCANSLALGGSMGPSELLLAPFVILGVLFATRSGRLLDACLAGLMMGAAFTIKQAAAFEGLLGLILVVSTDRSAGRALASRIAGYCLFGALPGLAIAGIYAAHGQFWTLWEAAVLSAFARTGGDGVSVGEGFLMFFAGFKQIIPLLLAALFAYTERRRLLAGQARPGLQRCGYWLIASCAGIVAMRAMYPRYFLTVLPPLSLLVSVFLLDVGARMGRRSGAAAIAAIVSLVCVYPSVFVTFAGMWPTENRNTVALAERLMALGMPTGPGRSDLFVADHDTATYLLTDTVPPTRYALAQHLTCNFALPNGVSADDVIDSAMDLRPRFVVVTEPRHFLACRMPERMARIDAHLARDYVLVDRIADRLEPIQIYERKDMRAGLATPATSR